MMETSPKNPAVKVIYENARGVLIKTFGRNIRPIALEQNHQAKLSY